MIIIIIIIIIIKASNYLLIDGTYNSILYAHAQSHADVEVVLIDNGLGSTHHEKRASQHVTPPLLLVLAVQGEGQQLTDRGMKRLVG